MEEFHFQNPIALWGFALLPFLLWLTWHTRNRSIRRLERFASSAAFSRLLLGKENSSILPWRIFFFYLSLFSLLLALARPQGNPTFQEHDSVGLDIMVVLDISRSMDAEDIYPSRLKKAKREINTLLDHLSGDRVGIVAFAGSAALMTPLTADYEVLRSYLEAIDTNTIQNQGTNIAQGLDVAMEAFQRGAQNGISPDDKSNLIILMSDGESNAGSTFDVLEKIRKGGISIFTIGFGTEKGVPIPIRDTHGELLSYKRNRRGENVISKVEPSLLKQIAAQTGGIFYFATLDEGEIGDILSHTQDLHRGVKREVKTKVYEEYFEYFLVAGVLLLLFSFLPSAGAIVSIIFLFSFGARAADSIQSPLWDKDRRLSEEAIEQYNAGKYSDATDILKSLQVENPSSPIVNYDLGTAMLKDKKYEEARSMLSEASKADGLTGLVARMNLAGSYAEEKKIAEAQSAYSEIAHELDTQKNLTENEKRVLDLARKNLELLSSSEQKKQQQQQQQQNQSKDNKDQNNQSSQKPQNSQGQSDPNKEPEKSSSPTQDEKKNESDNQKQYDHQRQTFQERQDLSEQDAKRMMEALKEQEKSAQKKFLKKLGSDNKAREDENEKDW